MSFKAPKKKISNEYVGLHEGLSRILIGIPVLLLGLLYIDWMNGLSYIWILVDNPIIVFIALLLLTQYYAIYFFGPHKISVIGNSIEIICLRETLFFQASELTEVKVKKITKKGNTDVRIHFTDGSGKKRKLLLHLPKGRGVLNWFRKHYY